MNRNRLLRPRPGALIVATGTCALYYEVLAYRRRREGEPPEAHCSLWYPQLAGFTPGNMLFYSQHYTYACWHCLEPLQAHVHGKCPFAPTRFLARRKEVHP